MTVECLASSLAPPRAMYRLRLAERDQRLASDTRGVTERWLGDPEPTRSALAQRAPRKATNDVIEQQIMALKTKVRGNASRTDFWPGALRDYTKSHLRCDHLGGAAMWRVIFLNITASLFCVSGYIVAQ